MFVYYFELFVAWASRASGSRQSDTKYSKRSPGGVKILPEGTKRLPAGAKIQPTSNQPRHPTQRGIYRGAGTKAACDASWGCKWWSRSPGVWKHTTLTKSNRKKTQQGCKTDVTRLPRGAAKAHLGKKCLKHFIGFSAASLFFPTNRPPAGNLWAKSVMV